MQIQLPGPGSRQHERAGCIAHPTRYRFFTGKGGVGKTSLSAATALALADGAQAWDHIVFDTAPTGHTLRLLSLPQAWNGFQQGNDRGASCLGPHAGLNMQQARFQAALDALSDRARTTVVLVTRPEQGALAEAAPSVAGLRAPGLANQRLVINGAFHASAGGDAVAAAIEALGQRALAGMPAALRELPQARGPLRHSRRLPPPRRRRLQAERAAAGVEDRTPQPGSVSPAVTSRRLRAHLDTRVPREPPCSGS